LPAETQGSLPKENISSKMEADLQPQSIPGVQEAQSDPTEALMPESHEAMSTNEAEPTNTAVQPGEPTPNNSSTNTNTNSSTADSTDQSSFQLWAGIGVNYSKYTQTITDAANVGYGVLKAPALIVRVESMLTEHWGSDFSYKSTPGTVGSKNGLLIHNGDYNWQSLTAEVVRCLSDCEKGKDFPLKLRFGVQHHQIPFLVPTDVGEGEIVNNSLEMATAGFEVSLFHSHRLRYDFLFRYQYPFSSGAQNGDGFDVHPKLAFDGSIGQVYQINPNWALGFYWYGQFHQYDFNYDSSEQGVTYSGGQTLFYSTFDLRLGYGF
jgi:hypothetical protein